MPTLLYRTTVAILGLFILGLLLGQILVPIVAIDTASDFPEVSHLVAPYSVLGILTLLCFQVGLIFIGLLLRQSARGKFFTDFSRTIIKGIAGLATLGCAIPVATAIHLFVTVRAGGPGVLLGMLAAFAGTIGFACLGAIGLRAFDYARAEHDELETVI